MKKFVKIAACFAFAVALCLTVASCKKKDKDKKVAYKLGMGVEVSLDSSKTGAAQYDATVASVVLDSEGKIVACRLDAVQNKLTLKDGSWTITNLKTKMELGDDYGMAKWGQNLDMNGDGVVKEWYDQAKAFENYVVGKTGDEVANLKTQTNAEGYQMSADDALLNAGCTIQITDFMAAVSKACKDDQAQNFELLSSAKFTLGVAATSKVNEDSTAATAEKDGSLNVYSDFAATVVSDDKIVSCINDAIQPKLAFNLAGEITGKTFVNTKRCLKSDYNMTKWGTDANGDGVVKEWYEQSKIFSDYVVGKTGKEVEALKTSPIGENDHYQRPADKELLNAGCTIQITEIKAVVAKAVANAR